MPDGKDVIVIHVDEYGQRTLMRLPAYLLTRTRPKSGGSELSFGSRCGRCGHPIDEGGHCDGCHCDHNPVPENLH